MPSVKEKYHDECNQYIEQFKIHLRSSSFNVFLSALMHLINEFCFILGQLKLENSFRFFTMTCPVIFIRVTYKYISC